MGLPAAAAALCIVGTLVLATASPDSDFQVGLFPPCSATLAPGGPCEQEGDGCPFVVNLPPMTVNLPKQLMDLERLVEELQMLKNNVDQLRKICKDCGASQAEKKCTGGSTQDADDGNFNINRQIWENNKRVVNEDRRKDGKSPKDKTEQVVAAGKNVRISERKKVDRKQIDPALDKQNSPLGNATTHMQNRTIGKSEVWDDQMMDSKRQTEAADETEDGGVKLHEENEKSNRQELHDKTIMDEKNYSKKINNQTKDEEDTMKIKDGNTKPSSGDSIDRHIWSDKHHKASHEDGAEKNFGNMDKSAEQPIDRDRPVWRDKTRVDTNQMERIEDRGGKTSDARDEGKNAPKSRTQSGHHVRLDETMETSSAERIKMSGRSDGDMGQDHRANGESDSSLKGNEEKLRDFENRELMEGTDLRSGGHASVVNSAVSHGFIDLDWSVTLTSPPTFTASHMTTDVNRGQKEQNNGRGSSNEHFKMVISGNGEKFESGGAANVEDGQLEWPVLEIQRSYDERKVDIDERYRPTKIASTAMPLDTTSNSDFSTDRKTVQQNSKELSKNVSTNFEQTNKNKPFDKRVKQLSKKANTTRSTTSDSDFSRVIIQGERKITSRLPSQTAKEKDINTEDSNLNAKSSTNKISRKDSMIINSNNRKTKISKTVPSSKKGSDTTTSSPTPGNAHITHDRPGRPKIERPFENNQGKEDGDNMDASLNEQLTKILSEDSNLRKMNISKTVSAKEGSDITASPTVGKTHITSKTKTAFGQPSENNQGKEDSSNMDASFDEQLIKIASEDSTFELTSTSDSTSSNNNSPFTDLNEEDTEASNEEPSQGNYNKMDIKTERSSSHSEFYQPSFDKLKTTPTPKLSHFTKNIKHGGKKASYNPLQNNPNKKGSNPMSSSSDTQLSKTKNQLTSVLITEASTSFTPMSSNSHLGRDVIQGEPKITPRRPSQPTTEKDISTEDSNLDAETSTDKMSRKDSKIVNSNHRKTKISITVPGKDGSDITAFPTVGKAQRNITDFKPGRPKTAFGQPSENNQGKASSPMSSGSDSQLSKTKNQLTTGGFQINQVDNEHSNHGAQYVTVSTPTTSKFEQKNLNVFNGQLSPSSYDERDTDVEHSSFDAPLAKATSKPNAVNEDASSLNSNSEITTSIEKEYEETNKDKSSPSTIKNLEKGPSSFDVSDTVQPVTNKLAEDMTFSTPTAFKPHFNQNSNQQETKQKTHGHPSTNYNEKDINSVQDAQMDMFTSQPATVLFDDTTSSTLRHHASFKDEIISTTFTSHQISPTTTLAPITGNNKKISSSKSVPNQRPKPSAGMKPEANLKQKNPKNDHKPDRTPSPDTQVKNNQRQMHPKVTPGITQQPAQIPPKSDQSTPLQVNVKDNPLPPATPIQKASAPSQTPTLAPRVTGLLIDERKRPNATSVHDSRQTTDSDIDKESRLKQLIKKTGNMKNNTRTVMLAQNRSSELNSTKEASKKSPKLNLKIPQGNQKPKPHVPKIKPAHPKLSEGQKIKVEHQAPKDKIPKINTYVDLKNSSKELPGTKLPTKPAKTKVIPVVKIKQPLKAKEKTAKADAEPTSGPIKLTTLNSDTAHDLAADPLRQNTTISDSLTMNPNSGVISRKRTQTTEPVPFIALTTEPNIATQVSTTLPTKSDLNLWEDSPGSAPRVQQLSPTVRAVFRSTAPPAPHPGPKAPAVESTTPSTRELRVKINQVAAFLNKSSQERPHGRPLDEGPGEQKEDGKKTDGKPDVMVVRDCSDHVLRGHTKSGLYLVTPDPSGESVQVLCDMDQDGGGWTVLQRRHDGSVSFNRSWAEYRDGFGQLDGGEFWLGNNRIHLLTRDRNMALRVELEDFEGLREYAQYELFKVLSERMRFRLLVDGYSGTAGDALRFNTKYNHNNRAFTTPDRDNDRYPSGNCGAYYSSGWWFDACMAANLNGRYYKGRYKGVRDGIYWGTWHNISTEYYPTNERLSFKSVRMMIRPKGFKP